MSGGRKGPPVHQNKFAWKPHAGVKINETEVGGRFRPFSEITGVCVRCKEQIDWKRKYGKYKVLKEPAKCQRCTKRAVRQAYHNLCHACAKERKVCAKCCCQVGKIVGRDSSEVEAEQMLLEEGIKNARERDRRTLIRQMNKGNMSQNSAVKAHANEVGKSLDSSESLEENTVNDDKFGSEDDDVEGFIGKSLASSELSGENTIDDDEFDSEADDDEGHILDLSACKITSSIPT